MIDQNTGLGGKDQIVEEAMRISELIVRHLNGTITPVEARELEQWAAASEVNRKSYKRLLDENYRRDRLEMTRQVDVERGWKQAKLLMRPEKRQKGRWLRAAVLVPLVLGGALITRQLVKKEKTSSAMLLPGSTQAYLTVAGGQRILLQKERDSTYTLEAGVAREQRGILKMDAKQDGQDGLSVYQNLETQRGKYQVVLSDGSRVWLNAASQLRFPAAFGTKERKVMLIGEAYFEISPERKRPFYVEADGLNIEVLGTSFNLMAYKDEGRIRATLVEGAVSMNTGTLHQPLTPGQQGLMDGNGKIRVASADLEETLAWKNDLFWFSGADINAIMRQLARWYDMEVSYEGNIPLHFTGSIPRNVNAAKVFEILEATGQVHFSVEGNKVTVRP